ncbi:MAG: hypothetical protein K8R36_14905 [Planctomycetales bacterium]|nr:hypothetical protein [Planctomycetales bacterium]
MIQSPAIAVWHARLCNDSDFEIAGSELATGIGCRVTVRRGEIDTAAFSRIDLELVQAAITFGHPLSIGATIYHIDRTFGPMFLDAIRHMARISAISATVQSRLQIVSTHSGTRESGSWPLSRACSQLKHWPENSAGGNKKTLFFLRFRRIS